MDFGENCTVTTELTFIEVQSGNPLIEEDIERTEWQFNKK